MILNPDIQLQLHQKVCDGLYPSEEIAIEEAIKLLNQKDEYIRYVNKAIEEGEADISSGRIISGDDAKLKLAEFKKNFLANRNS